SAARLGIPALRALALHNLGMTHALRGRVEEGLAVEREAIRMFRERYEPRLEAGAVVHLARILLLGGDGAAARAAIDEAASLPQTGEMRACTAAVGAAAALLAGRTDEALALADQADAALAAVGLSGEGSAFVIRVIADARCAAGDARAADTVRAARDRLAAT